MQSKKRNNVKDVKSKSNPVRKGRWSETLADKEWGLHDNIQNPNPWRIFTIRIENTTKTAINQNLHSYWG